MHPTSKAVVTETPTIITCQRKLHISLPTLNPTAEISHQTEKSVHKLALRGGNKEMQNCEPGLLKTMCVCKKYRNQST